MEEKNVDVDLENFFKSDEGVPATGASDQKEEPAKPNASEGVKTPEEKAASDRENARVRDLVDAIKGRDEIIAQLVQDKKSKTGSDSPVTADDVESFLGNVEDEPTRKLLKDYGDVLRRTIVKEFTPQVQKVKEMEFEKEFDAMASRFPQLEAFREEALKSFKANPNASAKSVVGEMVLEQNLSKPKPIEKTGGAARREQIDLGSASKEELYELLESMKE